MEENPHRVSRKNDVVDEDNGGQRHYNHHTHGEEDKCSGRRCRSWAAAAIADCVALCCCPCAIINFFTLTFIKVPWMIGRRCLGANRNNKKKKKKKKKKKRRLQKSQRRGKINIEDGFHHQFETAEGDEKCGGGGGDDDDDHRFVVERDGSLTKEEEEDEKTTLTREEEESRTSARVEADRVWLELYQIGHLGFGRVSGFND